MESKYTRDRNLSWKVKEALKGEKNNERCRPLREPNTIKYSLFYDQLHSSPSVYKHGEKNASCA